MVNKYLLLITLLFSFIFVKAQVEVVNDLQYNTVIKNYLKNNPDALQNQLKLSSSIMLPFRDDFSSNDIYPDQSKWTDNTVFINKTFAINPVTVGIATFDGADQYGNPYNLTNPNAYGVADSLTSQPINLNFPGDTTVYLSFYYQPQGRGNAPENADSLVLEFEGPAGTWNHIWSKAGSTNQNFQLVMIHITDPVYLVDGFRFRFKNYATLSGHSDHWHLDYVLLDRLRHFADTIFDDMAFVDHPPFLLEEYTAMPWQHFLVDPNLYLKDDISYQVRNLSNATRNVNFSEEIKDKNGVITFNPNLGNQNIVGNSYYTQSVTLPVSIFPGNSADSAEFTMKHIINTTPDINRSNDTLKHIQNFYNYYAYDDGTAEKAYGLQGSGNPGSPCFGCKMAMQFNPAKSDSLQAIMIHFTQIGTSVANNLFKLTVWSSLNPETVIYEEQNLTPEYVDSINGFALFKVDPPLYITDPFYVGTVQDNYLLNVGLDVNTNNNLKMYYNSTGSWLTSSINGTWMIRPVFGTSEIFSSVNENIAENNFEIYPNPASEILNIHSTLVLTKAEIIITDLAGRKALVNRIHEKQIEISFLPAGIYFLRIKDSKGNFSKTQKFVIN